MSFIRHFIFIFICFFSIGVFASVERTLLRCTSLTPRAPMLSVAYVADQLNQKNNDLWRIIIQPINLSPSGLPMVISFPRQASKVIINKLDQPFVFTADLGASGYAHIYYDPQSGLSLIDIELTKTYSTHGPINNYHCDKTM